MHAWPHPVVALIYIGTPIETYGTFASNLRAGFATICLSQIQRATFAQGTPLEAACTEDPEACSGSEGRVAPVLRILQICAGDSAWYALLSWEQICSTVANTRGD